MTHAFMDRSMTVTWRHTRSRNSCNQLVSTFSATASLTVVSGNALSSSASTT